MKVWRNGEGREFPVASETDVFCDALVGDRCVPRDVMQSFGYELVDSDSVTATASVEVQGGHDESVRLTILPRLRELRGDCQSSAKSPLPTEARLSDLIDILIDSYDASEKGLGGTCPSVAEPESDPEEFEVVAHVVGGDKRVIGGVCHERIIPGETYSVRKVKR